jgi:hypothetical protein
VTGNYFHDNGDGTGGVASFAGDDGYTITNNVFAETGVYPWSLAAAGCANCIISHNVTINSNLRVDTSSTNATLLGNVGPLSVEAGSTYTATYNLNGGLSGTGNINGTPVYVSSPSFGYYHYELASNSPGYHAASDGKSMGITP